LGLRVFDKNEKLMKFERVASRKWGRIFALLIKRFIDLKGKLVNLMKRQNLDYKNKN